MPTLVTTAIGACNAHMETMERLSTFTAQQLTEWRANDFIRLLSCASQRAKEHGAVHLGDDFQLAMCAERFLERYPRSLNGDVVRKAFDYQTKAAVNPGTTLEPTWGAPLAAV